MASQARYFHGNDQFLRGDSSSYNNSYDGGYPQERRNMQSHHFQQTERQAYEVNANYSRGHMPNPNSNYESHFSKQQFQQNYSDLQNRQSQQYNHPPGLNTSDIRHVQNRDVDFNQGYNRLDNHTGTYTAGSYSSVPATQLQPSNYSALGQVYTNENVRNLLAIFVKFYFQNKLLCILYQSYFSHLVNFF